MRRTGRAVAALFVTLIVGTGCPFETRDAVPPRDDTEPPPDECLFSDAITEGAALRNLELAFNCGEDGLVIVTETHDEELVFVPDQFEDQAVIEFFDGWADLSPPREGLVNAFTQHMSGIDLEEATLMIDAVDGDEVPAAEGVLFEDVLYTLDFDSGASFAGQADIFVKSAGSTFVIYRWEDAQGSSGLPTLTRFWFEGTAGQRVGTKQGSGSHWLD